MPKYRHSDEAPDPVGTVANLGLPLDHPSLHHPLVEPAPGEPAAGTKEWPKVYVRDFDKRIVAILTDTAWGREHYAPGDVKHFKPEYDWHHFPFEVMAKAFTLDELVRIKVNSAVMSDVSETFAKDPNYALLYKVPNSLWQYGRACDQPYGTIVRLYRGVARFDFGLPGFTSYFDHTLWECGTEGRARYGKFLYDPPPESKRKPAWVPHWLDGMFAYHVCRGDEPVLTVGFSFSQAGVLVSQVQVRGAKKGNRWLYKVKPGIREHVVARMQAAWPGFGVHLITGATQKAYSKYTHRSTPQDYPDETADRVAAFYDAPLAGYEAGEVVQTAAGWGPRRDFRRLTPAAPAKARTNRTLVTA